MIFNIYNKSKKLMTTILADTEEFVKNYCDPKGWSYSIESYEDPPAPPDPEPEIPLYAREQTAKVSALSDRQEFLEDCIAEMAAEVYK